MRLMHGCGVLLGALLLSGCGSFSQYDSLLAQARARDPGWVETAPRPVRHAERIRHTNRVKAARQNDEHKASKPIASASLATGTVARDADVVRDADFERNTGLAPRRVRMDAGVSPLMRERMQRPSPQVGSAEWKAEQAADARREREIEHTMHSICNQC